MTSTLSHLAAAERNAGLRQAAADHRRAQSLLIAKAAAEQRSPEPRSTRAPLIRMVRAI